jgi:ABC-type polysaccharide/polyol phosphate export permease
MNQLSNRDRVSGARLAWMLAKRDVQNRYANSYAGLAWSVGVPLLYSIINVMVFSILMKGRMGGDYTKIPFTLFYFVPFSLWSLFAEVTMRSPGILREYSYLINKIAFPAWVLPLVPFASAFLSQLILFLIIVGLFIAQGVEPAASAVMFVPIWACTVLITVGAAYAVSSIAVFIPDLGQLVPVLVTILFWLTPILYPATLISQSDAGWVRHLIMGYNPFYYITEGARQAVFVGAEGVGLKLLIMFLVAAFSLAAGTGVFRKLQRGFADVI